MPCPQQQLRLLQQQLMQVTPCQPVLQMSLLQQQQHLHRMQGRLEAMCCSIWFIHWVMVFSSALLYARKTVVCAVCLLMPSCTMGLLWWL